jgi:hypothetical protein
VPEVDPATALGGVEGEFAVGGAAHYVQTCPGKQRLDLTGGRMPDRKYNGHVIPHLTARSAGSCGGVEFGRRRPAGDDLFSRLQQRKEEPTGTMEGTWEHQCQQSSRRDHIPEPGHEVRALPDGQMLYDV